MVELESKHHKDFLEKLVTLMLDYGYECLTVREVRDKQTGEYRNTVCFAGDFNKLELCIDSIDIAMANGTVYIDAQYKSTTMNLIQLALSRWQKSDEVEEAKES